ERFLPLDADSDQALVASPRGANDAAAGATLRHAGGQGGPSLDVLQAFRPAGNSRDQYLELHAAHEERSGDAKIAPASVGDRPPAVDPDAAVAVAKSALDRESALRTWQLDPQSDTPQFDQQSAVHTPQFDPQSAVRTPQFDPGRSRAVAWPPILAL